MKKNRLTGLAPFIYAVCAFSVSLCALPSQAQTPPTGGIRNVSLSLTAAPITTALTTLFKSRGINFSLDPQIQPQLVTLSINDVSFDVALRALLNATNPPLTYDRDSGIYHVKYRVQTNPFQQNGAPLSNQAAPEEAKYYRIPLDSYDANYIAQLVAQQGTPNITQVFPNFVFATAPPNSGGTGGGGGGGGFGGGGGGIGGGLGGGGGIGGGGGGFGGGGGGLGGGGFGGGGGGFGGGGGGRSGY